MLDPDEWCRSRFLENVRRISLKLDFIQSVTHCNPKKNFQLPRMQVVTKILPYKQRHKTLGDLVKKKESANTILHLHAPLSLAFRCSKF
jgi:hypothetical protein